MARGISARPGAAALAALLLTSHASEGCLKRLMFRDGAKTRVEYVLVNPLDVRGPRDYFVRTQSQREGGGTIQVLPLFVYPGPFEFAFTGGVSDLELVDESTDAIACFELFEEAFFGDLDRTIDLCGRYTSGGYQVFNSENADQRFYPGTYLVDFRVQYDGAQVTFSSRPKDAPAYDVVTTFDFTWGTRLLPSFGAINFHKKGVYDLLDTSWTTTMPNDTTGTDGVGWHIQEAYRLDLEAFRDLDGGSPDFAGAASNLGLARNELSLAIGLAPLIGDLKIGKQVVRYLGRADKKLERAQGEVAGQDANGAISQVLKSARDQGLAFQALYSIDFKGRF